MNSTQFDQDLLSFLQDSPTPFHACAQICQRLEASGFKALHEGRSWDLQDDSRYYLTRNDSSVIAFTTTDLSKPELGYRMVGAHTDSPCLRVKPNPVVNRHGYLQLGVEVYGGALLNPWFDRDLSLAGRVSYLNKASELCSCLIDFKTPIANIPSLAIHLDREANKNRSINPQTDILPILLQADSKQSDFNLLLKEWLNDEHPEIEQILDHELSFYDTQAPAFIGLNQEFLSSARLDNLLSCYIGLHALEEAIDNQQQPCLLVCTDHEEVGSQSAHGAQGAFLGTVLERINGSREAMAINMEHSMMISADNAHGIHPNFADKHDQNHGPLLNAGPVIKINNNQRYATTSETSALIKQISLAKELPLQSFVVRSDMGCGSTIGPITAAELGVRTLDIGVPTFAMHSIRETAGHKDAKSLQSMLSSFFQLPKLPFSR